MSQNDPTDQALAAIASLFDQPASRSEPEAGAGEEKDNNHRPDAGGILHDPLYEQEPLQHHVSPERVLHELPSLAHDPLDGGADGYFKFGPGPLASIRFKWTVRRQNEDAYYVDETIGENSAPMVTGPMPADAAVRLVDARESEARRRFEQIKHEMTARSLASHMAETNNGKI